MSDNVSTFLVSFLFLIDSYHLTVSPYLTSPSPSHHLLPFRRVAVSYEWMLEGFETVPSLLLYSLISSSVFSYSVSYAIFIADEFLSLSFTVRISPGVTRGKVRIVLLGFFRIIHNNLNLPEGYWICSKSTSWFSEILHDSWQYFAISPQAFKTDPRGTRQSRWCYRISKPGDSIIQLAQLSPTDPRAQLMESQSIQINTTILNSNRKINLMNQRAPQHSLFLIYLMNLWAVLSPLLQEKENKHRLNSKFLLFCFV